MNSLLEDQRTNRYAVVALAIQWLLLTIALGTMIIYTDRSLEGLLGFHLDSGYAFGGAVVIGFLMGASVERAKPLVFMIFASCVAGPALYVALLFYPVWTGKLVHTVGLENFASTRALLYFGLASVPMALGGLVGHLASGLIPGGDLLKRRRAADAHRWWLDRSAPDEARQDASQSQ